MSKKMHWPCTSDYGASRRRKCLDLGGLKIGSSSRSSKTVSDPKTSGLLQISSKPKRPNGPTHPQVGSQLGLRSPVCNASQEGRQKGLLKMALQLHKHKCK
jgi:hypothetical protein